MTPAARPTDPLTAATNGMLLPAVSAYGFRRFSRRVLGRLGECAFQYIDLQKSAYGGDDFRAVYASMLLVPPEEYLTLQPGDELRRKPGIETWWRSADAATAETSMQEVVTLFRKQALPFFERTATVKGMYEQLKREDWGSEHHLELQRGACAAWLDETRRAGKHLERAAKLYEKEGLDWCAAYRERALALLDAIRRAAHRALLEGWRAESIRALKLEKLAG